MTAGLPDRLDAQGAAARAVDLFPADRPLQPGELIGRRDEIAAIVAGLEAGRHQIVTGADKSGKTSLADAVADACAATGWRVVRADLFHQPSLERLITTLAGEGSTGEVESLGGAIAALNVAAGGGRVLVLIDSFHEFVTTQIFGKIADIGKELRAALDAAPAISCLFVGGTPTSLRSLFSTKDQPFHRFGQITTLPDITEAAWRAGLQQRFADSGLPITADGLERLMTVGECHARTTMCIAQHTYALAAAEGCSTIDATVVDAAAAAAAGAERVRVDQQLMRLRGLSKHALTTALRVAAGESPYKNLPPAMARQTLRTLETAGIIDHPKSGSYRITDPQLRHHLIAFAAGEPATPTPPSIQLRAARTRTTHALDDEGPATASSSAAAAIVSRHDADERDRLAATRETAPPRAVADKNKIDPAHASLAPSTSDQDEIGVAEDSSPAEDLTPAAIDRHDPGPAAATSPTPVPAAAAAPDDVDASTEPAPATRPSKPFDQLATASQPLPDPDVPAPAVAATVTPPDRDVPAPAVAATGTPPDPDIPAPAVAATVTPPDRDVPEPAVAATVTPPDRDVPAPAVAATVAPPDRGVPEHVAAAAGARPASASRTRRRRSPDRGRFVVRHPAPAEADAIGDRVARAMSSRRDESNGSRDDTATARLSRFIRHAVTHEPDQYWQIETGDRAVGGVVLRSPTALVGRDTATGLDPIAQAIFLAVTGLLLVTGLGLLIVQQAWNWGAFVGLIFAAVIAATIQIAMLAPVTMTRARASWTARRHAGHVVEAVWSEPDALHAVFQQLAHELPGAWLSGCAVTSEQASALRDVGFCVERNRYLAGVLDPDAAQPVTPTPTTTPHAPPSPTANVRVTTRPPGGGPSGTSRPVAQRAQHGHPGPERAPTTTTGLQRAQGRPRSTRHRR